MVLRVCRGLLRDGHDAEDAFQAVFLVLANRAGSIRGSGSIAGWLFGVAQRVAKRSMRRAGRRRGIEQVAAEGRSETYFAEVPELDWGILHEEIAGLPERLRAPIVLCYLQGLTYAAAAHQLGVSEVAVRGRLARGRDRLRGRLTRRGISVPGSLVVAGAGGHAPVAVPLHLVHSTSRIALGFVAGNTAAVLARGVLQSMLMYQIRVATVVVCFAGGGGYWAWSAVGSGLEAKGGGGSGSGVVKAAASLPAAARVDRYGDPLPPGAVMRLGTVRYRQASDIAHIAHSADGQFVVTQGQDGLLVIRGARDGKVLRQVDLRKEGLRDFTISPDGRTIACIAFQLDPKRNGVANHVTLVEVGTGRVLRKGEWVDQDNVEAVSYLPDGQTVATVSMKGTLRLWDVATAKLVRQEELGEGRHREAIAFSRNSGSRMLAIKWQQRIDLWDVAQVRRVRQIALEGRNRPDCLEFSPDGTKLAAGSASRGEEIRLWRVSDGELLGRFKSRKNAHVSWMAFSPDAKLLAGIGSGGPLVFFDTVSGEERDLLLGASLVNGPLAFSSDGKTLSTTGDRQTLHSWDLATGKDQLVTPDDHQGALVALLFSNDGKTLVSGSRDQTARVWDLTTGRSTKVLPHEGWVMPVALSADGKLLVTGTSYPGTVRVWNFQTRELLRSWTVERLILRGATLSEDGSSAIGAYIDGSLHRWAVATGKERPIAKPRIEEVPPWVPGPGLGNLVDRALFSRDGHSLALMTGEFVQVMDVASGERRFKADVNRMVCAFAPDGESLAVVGNVTRQAIRAGIFTGSTPLTSKITWLDSHTGHVRREIEIAEATVISLAFSPDGRMIAVAYQFSQPSRGIIGIYRLQDKKEIRRIEAPCPTIEALAFAPDGRRIAAGLSDTSIVIWDVAEGR
jgi:RNA polymerase sigma factor (sigma-70 family)